MKKILFPLVISIFSVFLFSCNRSDNGPGRLVVRVTDDPFNIEYVESARVTISKIEVRKAGDNEDNPYTVLSEDTVSFDLLDLRNGITQEILDLEMPQGTYDQVRLYVAEASLRLKDNPDEFTVTVPGGGQTGIKVFIRPGIVVDGGLSSELLLDFDLSKSFVMTGNMEHPSGVTGFHFKPVVRATNLSVAGRITGAVVNQDDEVLVNAKVWLEQDSVISTAFTDSLGHYGFTGVPGGTYAVFATKENYDTSAAMPVVVYPGNRTYVDFILEQQ